MQFKEDVKPYQVPLRCITYALQEPFRKELEKLQDQQILAPLVVDETAEWCNSFVIVCILKSTVCLFLDMQD